MNLIYVQTFASQGARSATECLALVRELAGRHNRPRTKNVKRLPYHETPAQRMGWKSTPLARKYTKI